MVNAEYNSSQDMSDNLQSLKGNTRSKIYPNICNYYDELKYRGQSGTFQFEESLINENVERIIKLYLEVKFLRKFIQTKPQYKKINFNFDF